MDKTKKKWLVLGLISLVFLWNMHTYLEIRDARHEYTEYYWDFELGPKEPFIMDVIPPKSATQLEVFLNASREAGTVHPPFEFHVFINGEPCFFHYYNIQWIHEIIDFDDQQEVNALEIHCRVGQWTGWCWLKNG